MVKRNGNLTLDSPTKVQKQETPAEQHCYEHWGPYHDEVWGRPLLTSRELFEQLSLVSQQAGLSWRLVWNKREHYAQAFHHWDMRAVAAMGPSDLDALCSPQWARRLIQSRRKLAAIVHNARQCLKIEETVEGGLAGFLASFFAGDARTINTHTDLTSEAYLHTFGTTSEYSDAMERAMVRSKHAKAEWDFRFLGSLTLQAFALQVRADTSTSLDGQRVSLQVGLLNGHSPRCRRNPLSQAVAPTVPLPTHPHSVTQAESAELQHSPQL